MYTQFDKAIVAVIMAVATFVQKKFNINLGLDEGTLTTILIAITPILVWLFPNLPKDKTP